MADAADLVGYIVGEREDGDYLYACPEHTANVLKQPHRQVLRDEAEDAGATCEGCGIELAEGAGEG